MAQIKNLIARWDAAWPSPMIISRQYDNGQFRIDLMNYPEPEYIVDEQTEQMEILSYYLIVWMKETEDGEYKEMSPIMLPGPYWIVPNQYTQLVQDIRFQFCVQSDSTDYEAHSAIFTGRIVDSIEHDGTDIDVIPVEMFDAYKAYIQEIAMAAGAVVIDPNLDTAGAAADAKAVGDAIKAGKHFVVQVPGSAAVFSGSITAGDFAKALAAYTAGSGVYAVKDGEVYQLSAAGSSTMTFTQMYHGTMNFIKQIVITSADTFTVTNTALSYSAEDTSYSNATSGLAATNVQAAIDENAANLSDTNGRLDNYEDVPFVNLFSYATATMGYSINSSGAVVASTNLCISDYIAINTIDPIYIGARGISIGSDNYCAFYDAEKTVIDTVSAVSLISNDIIRWIPENAAYIRIPVAIGDNQFYVKTKKAAEMSDVYNTVSAAQINGASVAKYLEDTVSNGYWSKTAASITSSSSWRATALTPVKKGDVIHLVNTDHLPFVLYSTDLSSVIAYADVSSQYIKKHYMYVVPSDGMIGFSTTSAKIGDFRIYINGNRVVLEADLSWLKTESTEIVDTLQKKSNKADGMTNMVGVTFEHKQFGSGGVVGTLTRLYCALTPNFVTFAYNTVVVIPSQYKGMACKYDSEGTFIYDIPYGNRIFVEKGYNYRFLFTWADSSQNEIDLDTVAQAVQYYTKAHMSRVVTYPWESNGPRLITCNHRGYNSIAPENTLPAYRLSKSKGFVFGETDIGWTSDGVAVILHDSTINRTARNPDGTTISSPTALADLTFAQVREYDFGIWKNAIYAGTKIPTFTEFLTLCKKIGLCAVIQVPASVSTDERLRALAREVKELGMERYVRWALDNVHQGLVLIDECPSAFVGWYGYSISEKSADQYAACLTGYNKVSYDFAYGQGAGTNNWSNSASRDILRARGMTICVYDVNTEESALALPSWVDIVTGNVVKAEDVIRDANIGDPETGLVDEE